MVGVVELVHSVAIRVAMNEAAALVSVPEVSTPARRCAVATGGSGKRNGDAREEAGRSAASEGRGGGVALRMVMVRGRPH